MSSVIVPVFLPVTTKIVNLSLHTGTALYPSIFYCLSSSEWVSFDTDNLNNVNVVVSNLSFLSLNVCRVVNYHLTEHPSSKNLLNPFQPAYTKHHSTEAALLSVLLACQCCQL